MVKDIIISQEAIRFLDHERREGDANIVINRDDPPISCCNEQPSTFIISLKVVYGKKPNDGSFVMSPHLEEGTIQTPKDRGWTWYRAIISR